MTPSKHVKDFIKQWEGFCPVAKRCQAGVLTIGHGHTQGVREGQRITPDEADAMLDADIRQFAKSLVPLLAGIELTQNQYDALLSFAYNVGPTALAKSTLLRKVRANSADPSIRAEFMRWINAGGKPSNGLRNRRQAEADMYFSK